MGLSHRTARANLDALVAAGVLDREPGAGSRAAGFQLRAALDRWRVPWAVPVELVEFRARREGWVVPVPDLVRAPGSAQEGFFVRARGSAQAEILCALPGARKSRNFVRAPGSAQEPPPLYLGGPEPVFSASDSLSERERAWATVEAADLAAAITARGNGAPDPRSVLGPRVEAIARAVPIEESRRRLGTAPAHYGPPMLVGWLELAPRAPSGSPATILDDLPPRPRPEPEPDAGPALSREQIAERMGRWRRERTAATNGDHERIEAAL